jgi:predicted DNA-binding ribbon-helix-helix protein
MKSTVVKHSIVVAGHKTSVSLEEEFWSALKVIAGKRLMSVSDLVGSIDAQRQRGNLSSALRLFVLEAYRSQIPNVEEHNSRDVGLSRTPALLNPGGDGGGLPRAGDLG